VHNLDTAHSVDILNILLTLAYDGTNYCGWQRQKNALSVQEVLERVLENFFGEVKTIATSRTDAGVHALGQRVSFNAETKIPLGKLPQVLNSKLPSDIVVQKAMEVSHGFNPRFDAVKKTYCYRIHNAISPNPLIARYSAFVPERLDLERMRTAAAFFEGTHDFAAFCAAGSAVTSTVRTIFECRVEQNGEIIEIYITGDGFLYNMVRIIAGTLVYIGMKKPLDAAKIIADRDRKNAGKTMPARGLTLIDVILPI